MEQERETLRLQNKTKKEFDLFKLHVRMTVEDETHFNLTFASLSDTPTSQYFFKTKDIQYWMEKFSHQGIFPDTTKISSSIVKDDDQKVFSVYSWIPQIPWEISLEVICFNSAELDLELSWSEGSLFIASNKQTRVYVCLSSAGRDLECLKRGLANEIKKDSFRCHSVHFYRIQTKVREVE